MFTTKALKSSWAISWVMTELKPTILEMSSIFTISPWNGSVYINHGMVASPERFLYIQSPRKLWVFIHKHSSYKISYSKLQLSISCNLQTARYEYFTCLPCFGSHCTKKFFVCKPWHVPSQVMSHASAKVVYFPAHSLCKT